MKNKLSWTIGIILILIALAYFGYQKIIMPRYVANVILNEGKKPWYVPQRYEKRLIKSRKKINSGVDSVLVIMHRKNITLDQLLKAIDEVTEKQAYDFLDELNATTITSSNQVFDIGKKHFKPDFDVELFREIFVEKTSVPLIKRGLVLANKQRKDQDMSPETIRVVAKQLLIEKEKKYSQLLDKINSDSSR